MHASCCEGQGTRLFGSLPEYIYSLVTTSGRPSPHAASSSSPSSSSSSSVTSGVYVDLYADSAMTFTATADGAVGSLSQSTQWPYGVSVQLTLTLPSIMRFDLALRVPAWVASPSLTVTIDGQPWPQTGAPGSYLHVDRIWPVGASTISYDLPMAFSPHNYTGHSQLPPFSRWAYTYGPILLAAEGPWNNATDAIVMPPGLDPSAPASWMVPSSDGQPLHFNVTGAPGFGFVPYFEIQEDGRQFSAYPCFQQ